jgi:hypothetical protein
VLKLILLAPDIVETNLNGRQPAKLERLLRRLLVGWRQQQKGSLGLSR